MCWSPSCDFSMFYAIYSILLTSIVQPHCRWPWCRGFGFSRGWTKSSRPRGFPAMAQAPAANAGEHEAITQSMVEITRIVCHYSHIYRTNVILIILISCSILKIRKLIDVFNCIQLYSPWINLFQPVETYRWSWFDVNSVFTMTDVWYIKTK